MTSVLVGSALLIAVACAGCSPPRQAGIDSPKAGSLVPNDEFRLSEDSRTSITIPQGWSGEFVRADEPLYGEESLIGTVSVLPHSSTTANIRREDEFTDASIVVFRSEQDAVVQEALFTRIARNSDTSAYLPPLFSYSPSKDVTATCNIQFIDDDRGVRRGVRVFSIVRNPGGASFAVDATLPVGDPLYSGTKKPEEVVERLFDYLAVQY